MRFLSLGLVGLVVVAGLALALPLPPSPSQAPPSTSLKHVFIIVLENENYNTIFGPNPGSPYLGATLPGEGRLLTQYHGTGHASADNDIAMVSGQGPNPATMGDCAAYVDFVGAVDPVDGQAVGTGCIYPSNVATLGNELEAAGLSWRGYAQSMAASPGAAPTSCRHQPIDSTDSWQGTTPDQYATRHVPFVYFHSVIDNQTSCDQHVVDLALLKADLATDATTPNYVFITPDVCGDGHDATCANASRPGGYAGIDGFLREWIPRIQASPAYAGSLIVVTFDENGFTDTQTGCSNEPILNTPVSQAGPFVVGGGRVGALLLGPCIAQGGVDDRPFDHYSLLRTLEDNFHVPHLANAGQAGLTPLDLQGC